MRLSIRTRTSCWEMMTTRRFRSSAKGIYGWVELDNLNPDSTCRWGFPLMYNIGAREIVAPYIPSFLLFICFFGSNLQ